MNRCTSCCIPDTRPDTHFVDGRCSACVSFAARPEIDWEARRQSLLDLLQRHGGRCIVPSSGGKDSTWQVLKLLELGAKVTIVTARTCHLTPIGRANIDNLARYAPTVEVVPNMTQRAKLNRLGLELVGDISWPEHVAIFTTPFRMSDALDIPLIFYGENPQNQYGGPPGSYDATTMTRRWISEFGGFLGLRTADLEIMAGDMSDYQLPPAGALTEAHFLGQYLPWDSEANAQVAIAHGMRAPSATPANANWWTEENLDNAQTGLHDHLMYRKYGFGRGCSQISVDVRNGRVSRAFAMGWLADHDGAFPFAYMGVPLEEVLERISVSKDQLYDLLDRYTNWSIFSRTERRPDGVPYLLEELPA